MLLTLTNSTPDATDLGYLLHKHPGKVQSYPLSFGQAHVFYPEAADARCTACLMLDVDPIALVRKQSRGGGGGRTLDQYVNDRPYVASSFLSVALAQVYGSALSARCKDRPDAVDRPLTIEARLDVLPARGGGGGVGGGEDTIRRLFEPLGYAVDVTPYPLDPRFEAWGDSPYFTVTLRCERPLHELLTHLYVLVPVLDNDKHYWVDEAEVQKLLHRGGDWLKAHPEREMITARYLRHQRSLTREALARLTQDEQPDPDEQAAVGDREEAAVERPLSLNEQRHAAVIAALKASGATSVLDLGCAQGKLLRRLLEEKQFDRVTGMDVSLRSLEVAESRLKVDRMPERQRERLTLLHGSLMYHDDRLTGFDAACLVEVIEHLDPPRLAAMERSVFEFARPGTVIVTTPNAEYNVRFESLPAGHLRHRDHRFEWTRAEFEAWATGVAERYGYAVRFLPVGEVDEAVGSPTQMGVFERG